jgi:hypothetical protein
LCQPVYHNKIQPMVNEKIPARLHSLEARHEETEALLLVGRPAICLRAERIPSEWI